MADYNLHGLNSRDFQHLVQSIARKRIAPGVTAFGDGKDGNRDLTYRGKMDYPSVAGPWNGYLVMGCKFQQRPSGDSQKDRTWALKQLDGDLKKFLNKRRKLPKPDYYLFVTNVALSAAAETGGRDRVSAVLDGYQTKLRLRDYDVWDYNDLRGFLDGDADLRAAYGHFITAGDVLSLMMELLKFQRVDFADVMYAFLQKELIADMSAKLQSAGEDPEVQIPLAKVFVDLPFVDSAEAAVLASEEEEEKLPEVVRSLLAAGSSILRRTADDDSNTTRAGRISGLKTSRFVIVGGPGQGKSTFGQYLCQIYRAAILQDRPSDRLDDQVPKIVKQLDAQRKGIGGLPLTRRFPIRVELKNFAHTLAGDPRLTLLEYIRRDIARLGSASVTLEDLKTWLGQYPWMLVLDGLDEVPPSSNRGEVLRELESFRVDAASSNSDMLIVATTRPQSYSKEFSDEVFRHLYLTPLTPSQALRYGRKLAEARCGADERRRDELVRSLEKACENPATSRLMQSPLQVTIMATLLEDTGEPPQQRYRLFAEYYRTIYKRETRRKLLGGILTERQKDIDTIHAQAGLLLHASGEKTTAAPTGAPADVDSALSDDNFRALVRRRLDQIAVPPARAAELLDRISDGSLQRLVFLVRPTDGWVRFDITSFKEFMAAEAIMNGSDDQIRARIRVIAPASYWRNVFQFAVGKCFVERDYLLDNLVSLCSGLNEDKACEEIVADEIAGRAAKAVLWGSRLALDILADGTARQHPGYELQFARIALQLIRLGDPESCALLASVFHDDLQQSYAEAIEDRLGQRSLWSQLGAWHILINLADREVSWAIELLEKKWPSSVDLQKTILFGRGLVFPTKWVLTKIEHLAPRICPYSFSSDLDFFHDDIDLSGALGVVQRFVSKRTEVADGSAWSGLIERFFVTPCHLGTEVWEELKKIDFTHRQWFPFLSGARFGASPSAKTLAAELNWLAANWEPTDESRFSMLPWPLALCLAQVESREEILALASAATAGRLGDTKHWILAEQRWRTLGVTDADLVEIQDAELPLRAAISEKGFPFHVCGWAVGNGATTELPMLLEQLHQMGSSKVSSFFASVMLGSLGYRRRPKSLLTPTQFRALYKLVSRSRRPRWHSQYLLNTAIDAAPSGTLNAEWVEFLDWAGREGEWVSLEKPPRGMADELLHHFCLDPEGRRGLLPILAAFAAIGYRCELPQHLIERAMTWNSQAKSNAIGLALVRSDLHESEISRLARETFRSETLYRTTWQALVIASHSSLKQAAQFALALLGELSENSEGEADAAERARRVLHEFLTNKPSLLQDPVIWANLKLPQRL
jgi:hypothetical protein